MRILEFRERTFIVSNANRKQPENGGMGNMTKITIFKDISTINDMDPNIQTYKGTDSKRVLLRPKEPVNLLDVYEKQTA